MLAILLLQATASAQDRPRVRESGIVIGSLPPGPLNAVTDVAGVLVGHHTLSVGDSIRTGVTAILPHGGNLFEEKMRGAIAVGNGFGKLVGLSQVNELAEIETPIILTGTLSVFRAADALVDTLLLTPGNEAVESINPVVGETNDGCLSDIRSRPIQPEHVRAALRAAAAGAVAEGAVGAGTGTVAFGWKGGIGTSSRHVPNDLGGHTVGVLVQSNFGGILTVAGVPVGSMLTSELECETPGDDETGGSVMVVIATDAPLSHRDLTRVAYRAFHGIARTGSSMSHGSGDYSIAFTVDGGPALDLDDRTMTALFAAVMEATEEAVLNSLFAATTTVGFRGRRAEALPIDAVVELVLGARR